ncbi:hypothetical protein BX616_003564 [Lobosporangium transversale]|uniref:Tetraspanin Tsp2 n=1 Tax=Lobosporangium transversale TaxID=64571 RepID=A0A1Y2G961_9FUNG|nr:hypothetical protein BCR41DRAFT_362704 [Lobosporangium transversale]KAF9898831.1 hypothetical protein BX616_003564 [Lobosporangium transversale]ORZ04604.1 hypothetical protein BCR41DRAFT_362704 [Lobosporangium transversale]|eukprot:XP_021876650.1 hypothetical protein BCR41DRAFT_362704 [Lobosporangium transversale]
MPHNAPNPTESSYNNTSPQESNSSLDDAAGPRSPYLELIEQSFFSEQDLSLPERDISSPIITHANSPYIQTHASSQKPKDRIMNAFKRGSKDTLTPDRTPSPINYSHSVHARAQLQPEASTAPVIVQKSNSSYITDGSLSSLSTSVSAATPVMPKITPKQGHESGNSDTLLIPDNAQSTPMQQQQDIPVPAPYRAPPINNSTNSMIYNNNNHNSGSNNYKNNYLPPTAALAINGSLTRPASPFAAANSNNGSSDGREKTNSLGSTYHGSRNSSGLDPSYNLTRTDLTLEGLADRWRAYQALMKKRYTEYPFYKRWTKSKWILIFSNLLLLAYSCAVLAITIGYIMKKWELSVLVMEFHHKLVYLACAASVAGIATAGIGFVGIFRENRIWLSAYAVLLWPVFALYMSIGYISFRRAKSHLRAHVKDEWIHDYSRQQRLLVQHNLWCCGYQSASWYGAYDSRCFPLTTLPGCQHKYNVFEAKLLKTCWTIVFSIAPFHIFVMLVALLCSNHIDGMLRSGRPGLKSFKEEKQE